MFYGKGNSEGKKIVYVLNKWDENDLTKNEFVFFFKIDI